MLQFMTFCWWTSPNFHGWLLKSQLGSHITDPLQNSPVDWGRWAAGTISQLWECLGNERQPKRPFPVTLLSIKMSRKHSQKISGSWLWKEADFLAEILLGSLPWFVYTWIPTVASSVNWGHVDSTPKIPLHTIQWDVSCYLSHVYYTFRVPYHPYSDTKSAPYSRKHGLCQSSELAKASSP